MTTPNTRPGSAADTLYKWLSKGRRTDYLTAWKRWGIPRMTYHGAIERLRRHVQIDSDPKPVTVTTADGGKRTITIVTHQLIR